MSEILNLFCYRHHKKWKHEEEEQLIDFYLNFCMDINQLSYIHKRTPFAIKLRLIKLHVIQN